MKIYWTQPRTCQIGELIKDNEQVYLSFGGGLRLFSEEYFIKELAPVGMSTKGFRSFCRSLKVPLIFIGDNVFVDLSSFQLAIKAITRVGQPDFFVPGCKPLRRNKWKGAKELDREYFEKEWENVLAELIAGRKNSGMKTPTEVTDLARRAAKRITDMALQMQASKNQEEYTKKARALLEKELDES